MNKEKIKLLAQIAAYGASEAGYGARFVEVFSQHHRAGVEKYEARMYAYEAVFESIILGPRETGLTDADGRMICEGDQFEFIARDPWSGEPCEEVGTVVFEHGCFWLRAEFPVNRSLLLYQFLTTKERRILTPQTND